MSRSSLIYTTDGVWGSSGTNEDITRERREATVWVSNEVLSVWETDRRSLHVHFMKHEEIFVRYKDTRHKGWQSSMYLCSTAVV